MKRVFADTLYWFAVIVASDAWHTFAVRAKATLRAVHIVTTDEVLVEFLTALSGQGPLLRQKAVIAVETILADTTVTVLSQTHLSFLRGMELYARRPDKEYSLVDCISMNAMREEGITDILTNDHHFTQEGFNVLIHKQGS